MKSGYIKPVNLYFCGEKVCSPRHFFGPAVRPHYLLHFIFEGKGKYYAKGKSYHLKKGDAFLIKPGDTTYYEADMETPWTYAWIAFDGYEIEEILKSCNFTKENLVYIDEHKEELFTNIKNIVEKFKEGGYNHHHMLGYFHLIISSMITKKQNNEENYTKEYFLKAINYMKNNYSYDIKVRDIAKYVGVDRTYLYKIFIEEQKISPQKYLLNLRINSAVNMLKNTNRTITEVALSSGFIQWL